MAEEEKEELETEENSEQAAETEETSEEAVDEVKAEESAVIIGTPERHELSEEPVLDFESVLKPIEGENNAGEYLRYDGIYDEISEARRADEVLEQGAWQSELKVADFPEVIKLAVPVIATRSKDLQISAWLCEALGAVHGFAGARDGIRLIHLLLNNYWEGLYPEVDEGDQEGRANALSWVDEAIGSAIKKAPITSEGWGYNGFVDSKKFNIPDNLENMSSDEQLKYTALREQASRQGRATARQWKKAVALTKRDFCERVAVALEEINEEYSALNTAIEEKFDRNQAPSLPSIKKAIVEVRSEFEKILKQKRIEEPDASDLEAQADGESDSGDSGSGQVSRGSLQNRQDALRRLSEIAAFFKSTEPHSPVSYLVNRAIVWGNMPLEDWLEDVIKDQNILGNLKQTLGFNTVVDGAAQNHSDDPYGSAEDSTTDSSTSDSGSGFQPMQ